MKKAKIIEIEGVDGSGKTTGLQYLVERLRAKGHKVLETRGVGSPLIPICISLRKLVLDPASKLSGEAMELIFSAMRIENQKFYEEISGNYDFIVSDRGWFSHLAYTDHNVSTYFTEAFYLNFLRNMINMPDHVIYFDVNTDTALKRRERRGEVMDVIEMKGIEYQNAVRRSFEKYMGQKGRYPNTAFHTVDANKEKLEVFCELARIADQLSSNNEREDHEKNRR